MINSLEKSRKKFQEKSGDPVYSPNPETHLRHIEVVFQHLLKIRLRMKEIKCNILKRHIQYLGHLISKTGIEPLPEKN